MSEIDNIIKLLEEDGEYTLIQDAKDRVSLANKYGIVKWHDDLGRSIVLMSKLVNSTFMLEIKDYTNHVQFMYHDTIVRIHRIKQ